MKRAPRIDSRNRPRRRVTPRWLTTKPDLDAIAKRRVLMVLSVLSGETPVTTAIEAASISRGFYYQLETKALNAMLAALAPGGDGTTSNATGLDERIKELEARLTRAEQAKRRAERLLLLQRKLLGTGPMTSGRGRPRKTAGSTTGGPSAWRSSTTKSRPARRPSTTKGRPARTASTSSEATTTPQPTMSSPTPTGTNEDR